MAVNPQDLAEEQTQRAEIDAAGAPTEFAKDPAQGVQVAGLSGPVVDVIKRFKKDTITDDKITRVPTPQERPVIKDDGSFSQRKVQKELAPQVLSEEGVQRFEQQNFQAKPDPGAELIRDAQDAVDQTSEQQIRDITGDARKSLSADARGVDPEKAVVDEGQADRMLELLESKELGVKSLKDGGDLNFDYMDTSEDVMATITAFAEEYKDPTNAAKRGYVSNKVTIQKAAEISADEIGFTRGLLSRKTGQTWSAEELVGAREILVKSAEKLEQLATKINTGQASDLDRLAFRRQMSIHAGIQLQLKGAQTEAARALQSFQIRVGGEESAIRKSQEALRMLNEAGGIEVTDTMAAQFLDTYDRKKLRGVNEFARGGWRATTRQMLSEAYLAGLLSNPATQVKNIVGTGSFMLFQSATEAAAGLMGATGRATNRLLGYEIADDQVYLNDFALRFKGYIDASRDAIKSASIAFKTEMPAGASKLDVEQYTSIAGDSDSYIARGISEFGKRARIPFRVLLFSDEYFKTISQRGELYVQANRAYQSALRNGKSKLAAQDDAAMVLLDPNSVADDLIEKSKFDTLQSDLGALTRFSKDIQRFDIAGLPIGRYILPFTVAPTNAIIRSAEMVPIVNLATPNGVYDLLGKNGPRARQQALGRLSVGSLVLAGTAHYALQGRITGAFPDDPQLRDQLPPNWQPYSIVMRGDDFPVDADGEPLPLYDEFGVPNGNLTYASYAGYEPVGALLGIMSDTIQRKHRTADPELRNSYALAALYATQHYMAELPMLEGIGNLFDAFDSNRGIDLTRIFKSPAEATTIVGFPNPLSSLQRAGGRIVDPGSTRPRGDVEYFTEADILEQNADGSYVYANSQGEADYALIGLPKTGEGQTIVRFIKELDAYQAKNSLFPFRNDKEKTAPRYDSLGYQYNASDLSLQNNPTLAVISNLSGIRIRKDEDIPFWRLELMRLSNETGKWPFKNPRTKDKVKLSEGVISDWANQSKNETEIKMPSLGFVTFREAIEETINDPSHFYGRMYNKAETPFQREAILKEIETKFINQGWEDLMMDEKYSNIQEAISDIKTAEDEGKRRGKGNKK